MRPVFINDNQVNFIQYVNTKENGIRKTYEKIVILDLTNGTIVNSINIPRIWYTLTDNSIINYNSNIYHVLSTPDKAVLFKLNLDIIKLKSGDLDEIRYPDEFDYEFHFNNMTQ